MLSMLGKSAETFQAGRKEKEGQFAPLAPAPPPHPRPSEKMTTLHCLFAIGGEMPETSMGRALGFMEEARIA